MSDKIVNDFSITVGTVNGSGSQTANITILRALFKMGIPISGKNLFPSNIQGQPTWYTIRVNKDGFTARREEHEIVICMNPQSFSKDLADVSPGGVFFYTDDIKFEITRDDIHVYKMPVKELMREQKEVPSNLKDLVANMVYVGILAQSIGIDLEKIKTALEFHFKGKQKPVDLNFNVVKTAAKWAEENLEKRDSYYIEPMNKTQNLIMADGNTAAALGSIYGGVQFTAWYPITPASSLAEALLEYLPQFRKREDGKSTYAVVQAEDELAAIGMAIGAGWAGLRAMTSTSGPGLSLMTEFAGLAYYGEVPVVIWDVQRVGPSTGLPTRTSQGDLTFTHYMGHGDTEQVILLPGNVNECFEFGWRSFDIAEHMQTPVFVLSDLDLGMNQWMSEPFLYPDAPMDRGKVLWEDDLEKLKGVWGRYKDVDGDGIPYRTLPGNKHPSSPYFMRGTGHDEGARYTEDAATWAKMMDRIKRKYHNAAKFIPEPIIKKTKGAQIGILGYGSTDPAIQEASHQLITEESLKVDTMRIRGVPFSERVRKFLESHEQNFVVEMNRDGQMYQLLLVDYPQLAGKLISVAFNDGLPATARWIKDSILAKEEI
jgi:2-oxoglutarate/2-oxoacid ferredoxin oxidoreductase subunit alpha